MSLRSLILLNVVHQNFHAAANATVVGVKTEASDFQRFSAAFVLSGVDSRIKRLNYLVVAPKKCVVINRFVAPFNIWHKSVIRDGYAFADGRHNVIYFYLNIFEF